MTQTRDILLTALAPAIWGSSYYVATTFLPGWHPLLVAFLRALPAGLLLLVVVRQLPRGGWWPRVALLGALNFSLFWALLFVAAYRLPGGVAATVGAIQPLLVLMLSRPLLGTRIALLAMLAAIAGIGGVAMLILTPGASLDPLGLAAGLGGAASMALGTVLSRRWRPPVGPLAFTAWQLVAGGMLLLPAALALAPLPEAVTLGNVAGLAYLGLIGAALTYLVWFRGLARLEPAIVSPLGFLSPVTAVALGLLLAGETLTGLQLAGIGVIFASIIVGQRAQSARLPGRPLVPAAPVRRGRVATHANRSGLPRDPGAGAPASGSRALSPRAGLPPDRPGRPAPR